MPGGGRAGRGRPCQAHCRPHQTEPRSRRQRRSAGPAAMASPDSGDVCVVEADDDVYEVERICGKRWVDVRVIRVRRAKRWRFCR